MALVCLDTHILVWGIKHEATPGQEARIPQAAAFFRHLRAEGIGVLLPSIVAAELLIRVPPEEHPHISRYLQKNFIIAPFDLPAAAYYAKLWHYHRVQGTRREEPISRAELKADFFIVSVALARHADLIYSHDTGLRKFAAGHIEVRDMPILSTQLDLFKE